MVVSLAEVECVTCSPLLVCLHRYCTGAITPNRGERMMKMRRRVVRAAR